MKEWIVQYQRRLSLIAGALLILIALGMMFWDNSPAVGEVTQKQKRQSPNVRVMGDSSSAASPSAESPIMKAYREKQEEHLRYTLVFVVLGGIGFLVYGMINKKKRG